MPSQPPAPVVASLASRKGETFRVHRGVPLTATEWTALAKIASGECRIPDRDLHRLRRLGLVRNAGDTPELTGRGRFTLGLPD